MKDPVRQDAALLSCSIALPNGYREGDFFEFHNRDAQAIAERIEGRMLRKGLAWEGQPACLAMRFEHGYVNVDLQVDGYSGQASNERLEAMARRMLGLTQRVEDFEKRYSGHPQLGSLIEKNAGLRVPLAATPFEALTWAITGQQISLGAATALRRKLILAAGLSHSGGLACYPDAAMLAALDIDMLRQAGFSQTKAATLKVVSEMVQAQTLPLEYWMSEHVSADEIREKFLAIRGIGPWTVSYALLRGFGWLDGSLHGDAAVRRGLQALLGSEDKVTEDQAREWLAPFSPWRALVAAHLWAMR